MRSLKDSVNSMRPMKKELIVIDLDDDDDDEDAFCGEDSGHIDVTNQTRMRNDDEDVGRFMNFEDFSIDHEYKKFLNYLREEGNSYLLEINKRDIQPICLRYEVDNGGFDKRICSGVINKRSRAVINTKSKVISKASRSLNGRKDWNNVTVDGTSDTKKGNVQCGKKIQKTKKNGESKARTHAQTSRKKKEGSFKPAKRAYLRKTGITASKEDVESGPETHVKGNPQHNFEAYTKEDLESELVFDESYRHYLTWLAETERNSRANPAKEPQIKCEKSTMSLSDSGIIAVDNRPFLDGTDSPFVPLKDDIVVDVDEDETKAWDQRSSWFRKEIMNVLKQPYNKKEFLELYNDASERRCLTRSRELRDGRDITYPTKQLKPSYLDQFPDFRKKFRSSCRNDRQRALNLLRGFIFYLKNVVHEDSFKPWLDDECLKIIGC